LIPGGKGGFGHDGTPTSDFGFAGGDFNVKSGLPSHCEPATRPFRQ
jgi:hypothetical protein